LNLTRVLGIVLAPHERGACRWRWQHASSILVAARREGGFPAGCRTPLVAPGGCLGPTALPPSRRSCMSARGRSAPFPRSGRWVRPSCTSGRHRVVPARSAPHFGSRAPSLLTGRRRASRRSSPPGPPARSPLQANARTGAEVSLPSLPSPSLCLCASSRHELTPMTEDVRFEWHEPKALVNVAKHKVTSTRRRRCSAIPLGAARGTVHRTRRGHSLDQRAESDASRAKRL
jgi:hypothetical protein